MNTRPITLALCLAGAVAAAGGAAAQTVRFTLGSENAPNDFSIQAVEHWKTLLDERSNGEIQLEIIAGGALGSGTQILQQLSAEEIQASIAGPTVVHQLARAYQCMEAEYVYDDADHGYRVWTGALGQELSEELEQNFDITITGVGHRGSREVTANRPIRTPEDLRGVKIRVTNELRTRIFSAYGALPGPLPFSELYGALRQGVFDAQENPVVDIYGQNFYEVQQTLNLTGHVQSYYVLTSNKNFVEGLSEEHRAIYEETAAEAMEWLNDRVAGEIDRLIEEIAASGVEVVESDVAAFRAVAEPIVAEFAEANCRPGILEDIAAAR